MFEVIAEPPDDVVAAAMALATNQRRDGAIGQGGGSSLDCAKR